MLTSCSSNRKHKTTVPDKKTVVEQKMNTTIRDIEDKKQQQNNQPRKQNITEQKMNKTLMKIEQQKNAY